MPGVVGAINVSRVSPVSVVSFGDSYTISPKVGTKTYQGAGSGNTGNFMRVDSIKSVTNINDADISDQNKIGNA